MCIQGVYSAPLTQHFVEPLKPAVQLEVFSVCLHQLCTFRLWLSYWTVNLHPHLTSFTVYNRFFSSIISEQFSCTWGTKASPQHDAATTIQYFMGMTGLLQSYHGASWLIL